MGPQPLGDSEMKKSTAEYIKSVCDMDLRRGNNMAKAQVMLRNLNYFAAYGARTGYVGDIPFEELEGCLKAMVRKYDISVGSILAITDIAGEVTWNGGTLRSDVEGKSRWMFTVHASDLYEYMVKLVLMTFINIKVNKVPKRDAKSKLEVMHR